MTRKLKNKGTQEPPKKSSMDYSRLKEVLEGAWGGGTVVGLVSREGTALGVGCGYQRDARVEERVEILLGSELGEGEAFRGFIPITAH